MPPAEVITQTQVTNKVTRSTNVAPVSDPQTPGDPWLIGLGQAVTRVGSKSAWWILLILLAALIAVEVQRRRKMRRKPTE